MCDLTADPNEFVNLWGRPGLEGTQNQLKGELPDRVPMARDPLPARETPS